MNVEDQLIETIKLFPKGKNESTFQYGDWTLETSSKWNKRHIYLEFIYSNPYSNGAFKKVTIKRDLLFGIWTKQRAIGMYGSKSEVSDLFLSHKIALRLLNLNRGNLTWDNGKFIFKARIEQKEKRLIRHIREHCETVVNEIDQLVSNNATFV